MANRRRLEILIEARDNASGKIRQVGGAMDSLAGWVTGAGVAFAGAKFVRTTWELAQLGAEVDRVETSFHDLAGSNADEMMDRLRKASRGTINDLDLMYNANKAMMLGVTDDADTMARLLEVAAYRGRAMGRSTADAFSDITTGIGRISPLILDNLGIVTGGQATYDEYARSIGKAASALTDMEKRQALVNKVLGSAPWAETSEELTLLNRILGDTPGLTADAAEGYAGVGVAIENLRLQAGLFISQKMDASGLTDMISGAGDLLRKFNEADAVTRSFRDALKIWNDTGQISSEVYEKLGAKIDIVQLQLAKGEITEEQAIERLVELTGVTKDFTLSIHENSAALRTWKKDLEGATDDIEEVEAVAGSVPWDFSDLTKMLEEDQRKLKEGFKDALGEGAQGMQGLIDAHFSYRMSLVDTRGQIALLQQQLAAVPEGTERWYQIATRIESLKRGLQGAGRDISSEMQSLVESVLQPTQVTQIDAMRASLGIYVDKWDESARRLDDIANRGTDSPWIKKFDIPQAVLDQGPERIKLWAMEMADAVRNGLRPELIDVDSLDKALLDAWERQQGRDRLVQLGMERAQALGLGFSQAQIGSIVGGDTAAPGASLAEGMIEGAGTVDMGLGVRQAFETQTVAQEAEYVRVGAMTMTWFLRGAETGITPQTGYQFARQIWPFFETFMAQGEPAP